MLHGGATARLKKGPPFLKVGGRVVYRLEDVESYEASQVQRPSGLRERSDSPGAPERDG